MVRGVETLLGIKPKPTRRSVLVETPAAGVRGARILPPDFVLAIVIGAIVLGGCSLSLAAIVAGRRRG